MESRVIVADRDLETREAYRVYLEQCGCAVETAGDAIECLEKVRSLAPDAVVLGQGMPWGGADGVVACMRDDPAIPSLPVLIVEDENSAETSDAEEAPRIVRLSKPIRRNALTRAVLYAVHGEHDGPPQ